MQRSHETRAVRAPIAEDDHVAKGGRPASHRKAGNAGSCRQTEVPVARCAARVLF
jgi:hypothetical protein